MKCAAIHTRADMRGVPFEWVRCGGHRHGMHVGLSSLGEYTWPRDSNVIVKVFLFATTVGAAIGAVLGWLSYDESAPEV